MYDTSTGQWRALLDMSLAREGCAAVCIDGSVYVMGGYDGRSSAFLKSAEVYDPSAGQWRALPDMNAGGTVQGNRQHASTTILALAVAGRCTCILAGHS